MHTLKVVFLLLAFCSCGQLLLAVTGEKGKKPEASMHGQVMDASTGKPVSGVTISVTSNKLQGEREITSDASGNFNFGKLPAGEVRIMFEKKGYKLFKKDVLSLKEGTTVNLSIEVEHEAQDGYDIWHPLYKLLSND